MYYSIDNYLKLLYEEVLTKQSIKRLNISSLKLVKEHGVLYLCRNVKSSEDAKNRLSNS